MCIPHHLLPQISLVESDYFWVQKSSDVILTSKHAIAVIREYIFPEIPCSMCMHLCEC